MRHGAQPTARLAVCVVLATTLAACHTTRVVWSKPGGDQTALQSDLTACLRDDLATAASTVRSRDTVVGGDIPAPSTRRQVRCMLDRGWKLTPLPSS